MTRKEIEAMTATGREVMAANVWSDAAREAAIAARRSQMQAIGPRPNPMDGAKHGAMSDHAESATNRALAAKKNPALAHEQAANAHLKAASKAHQQGQTGLKDYHNKMSHFHERAAEEHEKNGEGEQGSYFQHLHS